MGNNFLLNRHSIMNKILLALTVIGSVAVSTGLYSMATAEAAAPYPAHIMNAWAQWKKTHTRLYASAAHEESRLHAFAGNYNYIQASNANPEHTFRLGLNKFSDMTTEEFMKVYLRDTTAETIPEISEDQQDAQLLAAGTVP